MRRSKRYCNPLLSRIYLPSPNNPHFHRRPHSPVAIPRLFWKSVLGYRSVPISTHSLLSSSQNSLQHYFIPVMTSVACKCLHSLQKSRNCSFFHCLLQSLIGIGQKERWLNSCVRMCSTKTCQALTFGDSQNSKFSPL